MKYHYAFFTAILCTCFIFTANAQRNVPNQDAKTSKPVTSKNNSKIGSALQEIYKGLPASKPTEPNTPYLNTDLYLIKNGKVRIEASAVTSGAVLEKQLKGISGSEISVYKRIVNAWIPIKNIMRLQELSELQYADVVYKVTPDIGSVDSEADSAMASKIAKKTYCLDGSGVKIGIISDTYDANGGAAGGVATGDLPGTTNPNGYTTPVTVVLDAASGIDEGRAMSELVHDVAPGAQLFFSSALYGQAAFANSILGLANTNGCDVIVDDIRYFEEPFYMDGIIAQACDKVWDLGVPYFASAGNYAQSSYEAPYFENRGSMWHDFDPGIGVDTMQSISVSAGSSVNLTLQWDDPWGTLTPNGPQSDIDLYVYDAAGTSLYFASTRDNFTTNEPTEFIGFSTGGSGSFTFNIAIKRYSGNLPSSLKWVIRNASGLVINEFSTPTTNGQSTGYGHSNAAGANAVGACWWNRSPAYGVNPPLPESFTSSGGVQIRYDTNGVALATPITRPKPEFTAIDGVSNTFFGSGNKFFGTSAAAPNAAAVACLMLEADGTLTPSQVRTMLANSAIDMSTAGFDYLTGTGLIQADSAIAQVYAASCSIDSFSLVSGPTLNPGDTTYNVVMRVHYRNNVCSDTLMVANQMFVANTGGTQDFTMVNLPADGVPVSVVAKFLNNPSCILSALAPFLTPTPPVVIAIDTLVITEIMYNSPLGGSDKLEFIEVHNPMVSAVNLNGYGFTSGVAYTFGNVSIPAGGYVVVCEDSTILFANFGVSAYTWNGALLNGGELLLLKDNLGNTLDSVHYDNSSPWPTAANGTGPSLVLCNPGSNNALGANWTTSTQSSGQIISGMLLRGSPGSADKACGPCPLDDSTTVNLITCDTAHAGTIIATLQNGNGCDSIVTTVKTYDPGSNSALPAMAICQGDSLLIFGMYQSAAATYYDTIPNANGCDSIISKTLTVNPVDTTQLSATTTDSTQAGVTTQVLSGTNFCDSVVITTTTYVPDPCAIPDSTYETVYSCISAMAGVKTDTVMGSNGCDSLHTTTTIYDPGSSTPLLGMSICEGDSISVFGVYQSMAGVYFDTLLNKNGCDSILSKMISVNPIDTTQLSATTNDSAQAGVTTQILSGSNNCDSIIITTTTYVPLPSLDNLRITEIMYNPPESNTDTLEYIEVYNAGSSSANLNGYSFSEGVAYTFGNVTLSSGSYIVVAGDSIAVFNTFGISAYEWSGTLVNGGEDIVLKDNLSRTLDSVEYDNNSSWPAAANGSGPSIVLCDLSVDQNDGNNWKASTSATGIISAGGEIKGSPGAADLACAPPVDCQLSAWSAWSACDTTCGGGQQTRTRTILVQGSGGGIVCDSTDLMETRACNTQPCPVDCQVSAWGPWSACDTACGGGTRTRTRTIVVPAAHGGAPCPVLIETDTCNMQPCVTPVDCQLSAWSAWSACDTTCGGGQQTRTRTIVVQGSGGGIVCDSTDLIETRACNTQPCPVDCQVSAWGPWSACDTACGGGTRTRTRTIVVPAAHGGAPCPILIETDTCNMQPCVTPVDCQLSAWSAWSACDTTCGGGQQTRTRTILVQGSGGGIVCDSTDLIETRACNTQPCPVDCQVSAWGPWSACDTACGGGTRSRTRTIVVPPSNGGAACPALIEYEACNTQPCNVKTTMSLVSDSGWTLSTVITTATANSYPWPGVASVPDTSTFTLPAIVGQPYSWEHLYTVSGSQVIKAGSGVSYYRKSFKLTDHIDLNARFRMFVDDDMQIFINGNWIALEDGMGVQNWRTVNHDILFNDDGTVVNPNAGGDPFDYHTNLSLDSVFKTGNNDVVLAIRNRTSKPDLGGFSFRLDLDKSGSAVIVKTSEVSVVNKGAEVNNMILYPNPTEGVVEVLNTGKLPSEDAEVILQDFTGKIIYRTPLKTIASGSRFSVDLAQYPAGVYVLRLVDGEISIARSIIKK